MKADVKFGEEVDLAQQEPCIRVTAPCEAELDRRECTDPHIQTDGFRRVTPEVARKRKGWDWC